MLSWCAYCQQFQGEIPPFEVFEISHGMCDVCARKDSFGGGAASLAHARALQRIQTRLAHAGRRADRAGVEEIVDEAVAAGTRPIDILIGLTAPLLYKTGLAWEAATLTVAEEHRFTAFCEETFAIVEMKVRDEQPGAFAHEGDPHPEIVVVNAPGNRHTFGIRVLVLWLLSRGRTARMILSQTSVAKLVEEIVAAAPRLVAISVALPEQHAGAVTLVERLVARGLGAELIVGGNAVKQGMCPEIAGASLLADITVL